MSDPVRPLVVALGGNALSPDGAEGTIDQQFQQTTDTVSVLADLLESGARPVITHGNGPQVGNALRRVELSSPEVYGLPLDVCVADLQGGMGYMIGQCLRNEMIGRGRDHPVATVVTSVVVDPGDPAFSDPTKPVGPWYDEVQAAHFHSALGWQLIDVPNKGFRRVVPSPMPQEILEMDVIRRLVAAGDTVITVGGGGIPVTRDAIGRLEGREAVIDKDFASALLARDLGADVLMIVTSVEKVAVDFGTPEQRDLDRLTTSEAQRLLDEGQFPRGSMGPKIEAALQFLNGSDVEDARVIITDIPHMRAALNGTAGTLIVTESTAALTR